MVIHNQVAQTAPTITLVGSASRGYIAGATLAFSPNNTAGNLLICAYNASGISSPTLTDSQANVWHLLQNVTDSATNLDSAIFYCPSCKGGANTVTLPATFAGATVAEFSGVTTVDQTGKGAQNGGATYTTNAITTLFAKELIVGLATNGSGALTTTAPFAILGTNETYFTMFYEILSAIQTGLTVGGADGGGHTVWSLSSFYTPTVNPNSVIGG